MCLSTGTFGIATLSARCLRNTYVVTELHDDLGRDVARLLVARGHAVRGILPDVHRDDALADGLLRNEKIDLLRCRLDDELGLAASLRGAVAAFICMPPLQLVQEENALRAFVNAARDSFLGHVVVLSMTGSHPFARRAEEEIARVVPSTTVVRGAAFVASSTVAQVVARELVVSAPGTKVIELRDTAPRGELPHR